MKDYGNVRIPSDPTLLADIRRYGKLDATGCYPCGSCTISCDLVTDSVSFPRQIMRYALLGLRKPLVESLEPWVCHDGGDCSPICPRQADPQISMMTVRRFLTAQYDWTGISSKILASRAWHYGFLGLVSASVLLLVVLYHLWHVGLPFHDFVRTPMGLEHMFPIMKYYTLTVILLPLFLLLARVFRIWGLTMRGEKIPLSAYFTEAGTYVRHSVTHILRYAGFEMTCHFVYALRIVIATPILVVELSLGKWSHMIYRPLNVWP